jgi:hypothetical protein
MRKIQQELLEKLKRKRDREALKAQLAEVNRRNTPRSKDSPGARQSPHILSPQPVNTRMPMSHMGRKHAK